MFFATAKRMISLRKMESALLIFVLSGLLSLCCCQLMLQAEKDEHCPLAKTSHCNFSKSDEAQRLAVEASATPFECCGLRLTLVVAKVESKDSSKVAPAAELPVISSARFTLPAIEPEQILAAYKSPDYHGPPIHIRNCVFRI